MVMRDNSAYLLDNGRIMVLWLGHLISPSFMQQVLLNTHTTCLTMQKLCVCVRACVCVGGGGHQSCGHAYSHTNSDHLLTSALWPLSMSWCVVNIVY